MSQQFTGRHFLLIMLSFFGVIIAVNITMAVFANTSWTGFVVRNSHVAGLEINQKLREKREQAALGWSSRLTGADRMLRFALADAQGNPIRLQGGTVAFRRPVNDAEDSAVTLRPDIGGSLAGGLSLGEGAWIAAIEADVGDERKWRETFRILVHDGAIR